MNKEKLIIYGASNYGMKVYLSLQNQYNILFFVDSDTEKQGTVLLDKKICSPKVLSEYKDVNIIIGSSYFEEIFYDLSKMGIKNILKFQDSFCAIPHTEGNSWNDLNENKTINLGEFLKNFEEIKLKTLTFIPGGSGVLDYAFKKL
ncbi:hypothetical protein CLPUN_21230 [Clostridium puniceum]|uniref:PglD N-terminal domain-containing protein n=1 Tax=Clostridium puniceum TaxID=29367 RepID=A0A1S8TJH5_9CLOT|nr:hypothetical protein [Clostridium puniceum]OOM77950.1 hypothetical protein CLPUN_21230 [Clostridium puniceum]